MSPRNMEQEKLMHAFSTLELQSRLFVIIGFRSYTIHV